MDTSKEYFVKRTNQYGILLVRERTPKEDYTGWGALEFILNNGEVFVISGYPFGQGEGEEGLWVDMNLLDEEKLGELRERISREPCEYNPQKSMRDYLKKRLAREL